MSSTTKRTTADARRAAGSILDGDWDADGVTTIGLPARAAQRLLEARGWTSTPDTGWTPPDGGLPVWEVESALRVELLAESFGTNPGAVLIEWDGGFTTASSEEEAEAIIGRKLLEWEREGDVGTRADFTIRTNAPEDDAELRHAASFHEVENIAKGFFGRNPDKTAADFAEAFEGYTLWNAGGGHQVALRLLDARHVIAVDPEHTLLFSVGEDYQSAGEIFAAAEDPWLVSGNLEEA